MRRLLDLKKNGKFPFAYKNSAQTNVADTFRRERERMKDREQAAPRVVLPIRKAK